MEIVFWAALFYVVDGYWIIKIAQEIRANFRNQTDDYFWSRYVVIGD